MVFTLRNSLDLVILANFLNFSEQEYRKKYPDHSEKWGNECGIKK
jgi:hypothetical protein